MIYSRQHRILFAHVSRTGGMAVTECLRNVLSDGDNLTGQHDALANAKPLLGADFEKAYKFAFVRNPWDRFVSWYALVRKANADPTTCPAELQDPESAHWEGFDAFLEKWVEDTTMIDGRSHPRLSQWAQLADAEGNLLANGLGRFESFAEDIFRLFEAAGLAQPAPRRINASAHLHYSLYYSDAGRELVEQVFHEDVVRLGYRFEQVSSFSGR